jgi:hypothetical protein
MVSYKRTRRRGGSKRRIPKRYLKRRRNAKTRKNIMKGGGIIKFDYGIYNGEINNINSHKIPNGQGVMRWNDGNIYYGNWDNGVISGNGVMKWKNGNSYNGGWINGMRHGFGIMIYKSRKVAEGQWVNGEPTGVFTVTWPNNDKHEMTVSGADIDDLDYDDDASRADTPTPPQNLQYPPPPPPPQAPAFIPPPRVPPALNE